MPDGQFIRTESKHERFLRLAPGRVQRAIDALRQVARLSLPENEYNDHEARQILAALQLHLDDIAQKLARKKKEKEVFKFRFECEGIDAPRI